MTLHINFNGGLKLGFANHPALGKWYEDKAEQTLRLAKRTKAKKEQIRLLGMAEAHSQTAAVLAAITVDPDDK